MDKKMLGKRINIARKDMGLTSEKLSEYCNINATYLRQIEAGAKTPSLPVLLILCNKLNVSPTFLLQDSLESAGSGEMDSLFEIWKDASPSQIKIINSLIKSVLQAM